MLYAVIAVVAAAAGFVGGMYARTVFLARKARTDREFGQALLEALAARWGARLELVQPLSPSPERGGPAP